METPQRLCIQWCLPKHHYCFDLGWGGKMHVDNGWSKSSCSLIHSWWCEWWFINHPRSGRVSHALLQQSHFENFTGKRLF
ncbi:hypothetical protein PR202_ga26855 [Eleusine coracana subsp. coracana]|uniref:Uncharacterized protein n=1 Tax=Eleusine coracana subsp. coracana TaxID=191504 RepID=A0AAV5DF93_ELECO|nr:hypothetical protein PR202_ga26855 [Eleusine coracana subsp. coracana]